MTRRASSRHPARFCLVLGVGLLAFLLPTGDAFAQAKGRKAPGKAAAVDRAKKADAARKAKGKRPPAKKKRGRDKSNPRVKVFDFTGLDLAGRLRTPQLIYFLDRAAQELELASLEKRSFVPEIVKSVDEESL